MGRFAVCGSVLDLARAVRLELVVRDQLAVLVPALGPGGPAVCPVLDAGRFAALPPGLAGSLLLAVRRFLAESGYVVADVTIDADDWAYNAPFVRCAERGDRSTLAALRQAFVREHVEELRRVRAITRKLAGRDVPQVLLLHAGAAEADAIDALLTAFEAEGVRWVGLRAALADPFYAPATHAPAPFGSALPYVLAQERGLNVDPPVWARGLEAQLRAVCLSRGEASGP
jgi:hypothetical protein